VVPTRRKNRSPLRAIGWVAVVVVAVGAGVVLGRGVLFAPQGPPTVSQTVLQGPAEPEPAAPAPATTDTGPSDTGSTLALAGDAAALDATPARPAQTPPQATQAEPVQAAPAQNPPLAVQRDTVRPEAARPTSPPTSPPERQPQVTPPARDTTPRQPPPAVRDTAPPAQPSPAPPAEEPEGGSGFAFPIVIVEGLDVLDAAPEGQGARIRVTQLLPTGDTLALSLTDLGAASVGSGGGRVLVSAREDGAMGTTRIGQFLVTARAPIPPPELEALLARLIEVRPD
jgi:hypothetical protein